MIIIIMSNMEQLIEYPISVLIWFKYDIIATQLVQLLGHGLGNHIIGVRFSLVVETVLLSSVLRMALEAHPVSYSMCTWGSFPCIKHQRHECDHSSTGNVKNVQVYPHTTIHINDMALLHNLYFPHAHLLFIPWTAHSNDSFSCTIITLNLSLKQWIQHYQRCTAHPRNITCIVNCTNSNCTMTVTQIIHPSTVFP